MAENVTLGTVSTFTNDSSAVAIVNANSQLITNAFTNVLDRYGSSPNQMQAVLDMNNFNIINLPSPATINSPARLVDVVSNPTISVPTVGTSGSTVPLLNGINTWSATQTFTSAAPIVSSASNTWSGTNNWSGQSGFTGQMIFTGAQSNNFDLTSFGIVAGTTTDWLYPTWTDPFGPYAWLVGPTGQGGLLVANRSSDYNGNLTNQLTADLITLSSYCIHDATTGGGTHPYSGLWNNYWLTIKTNTALTTPIVFGLESTILNAGPNVTTDSFSNPVGATIGMRIDSGYPIALPQNVVSSAIEIANVGSTFYTALCVKTNAITSFGAGGLYQAIQLSSSPTGSGGPGHSIVWYSAANTISGYLEVDTGGTMRLNGSAGIATNNNIYLVNTSAISSTAVSPITFSTTAGFGIYFGSGAPTATAAQGSLYLRSDGSSGTTRAYINNSSGSGTTWTAINTVA